MAHFALIEDGVVTQVIAVNNEAVGELPFPDSEPIGQAMLAESGFEGEWLQCSYSGSFRGAYPAQGWLYDPVLDEFVSPEPPAE